MHLVLSRGDAGAPEHPNHWPVMVLRSVFLGDLTQTHVRWGQQELVVRQTGPQNWREREKALLSADPQRCALLEGN
ncbi:TOBE domain-containing protein [Bosea thiooxidans]|nr:TOBE domain-containing protein [Bosea sp. (in: a-proteobacteria)]